MAFCVSAMVWSFLTAPESKARIVETISDTHVVGMMVFSICAILWGAGKKVMDIFKLQKQMAQGINDIRDELRGPIESKLSSLQTAVGSLQTSVRSLQTSVESLQTSVESLRRS